MLKILAESFFKTPQQRQVSQIVIVCHCDVTSNKTALFFIVVNLPQLPFSLKLLVFIKTFLSPTASNAVTKTVNLNSDRSLGPSRVYPCWVTHRGRAFCTGLLPLSSTTLCKLH